MDIEYYHFHLYYEPENIDQASKLRDQIGECFDVALGRLWDRPVGPHPIGSCQISVSVELFQEVLVWLMENRRGIDVFIHPATGDDLKDHSEHAMWLGRSYPLKLDMFKSRS